MTTLDDTNANASTPKRMVRMTFLGIPVETAALVAEWLLIAGGIAVAFLAGLVAHLNGRVKLLEALRTDTAIADANNRAGVANQLAGEANERAGAANKDAAEANVRTQSLELSVAEQQERAAKAEARVLELEQKNEPRRLSEETFARLVDTLRKSPVKGKVQVAWVSAGPEPVAYGNRFLAAIKAAGWETIDPTLMMDISGFGVAIVVRDLAKAPPHAVVLQQILKSVGIEADGTTGTWVADDAVQLLILSKQ